MFTRVCRYDTVEDKRWGVNIRTHQIKFVIDNVLLEYDSLPTCYQDDQCVDCFNWKYKDVPVTSTWTTDTETRTTRTGTCKTPGWWGCLDESTTTTTTSSTTGVTVTSTETCSSYGWFGECLDETPTTRPSSSSTSSITTTETCSKGYDWFGDCIDKAIRSQAVFATHTNQRVMTITRAP